VFVSQSFPTIVALETSSNSNLSARANILHTILHSKHMSLLNTRYALSAKASFEYQKTLGAGPVQGLFSSLVTWRNIKSCSRFSNAACSHCFVAALVFSCSGKTVFQAGLSEVTPQSI
jgi:hypothetical protein